MSLPRRAQAEVLRKEAMTDPKPEKPTDDAAECERLIGMFDSYITCVPIYRQSAARRIRDAIHDLCLRLVRERDEAREARDVARMIYKSAEDSAVRNGLERDALKQENTKLRTRLMVFLAH